MGPRAGCSWRIFTSAAPPGPGVRCAVFKGRVSHQPLTESLPPAPPPASPPESPRMLPGYRKAFQSAVCRAPGRDPCPLRTQQKALASQRKALETSTDHSSALRSSSSSLPCHQRAPRPSPRQSSQACLSCALDALSQGRGLKRVFFFFFLCLNLVYSICFPQAPTRSPLFNGSLRCAKKCGR